MIISPHKQPIDRGTVPEYPLGSRTGVMAFLMTVGPFALRVITNGATDNSK